MCFTRGNFLPPAGYRTKKVSGSILYVNLKLCVCSPKTREGIHQFTPNLAFLFLETRKRFQKGQNAEKLYWVRVPARVISVTRKLRTIEGRQDKNYLFWRGDYGNQGYKPKNYPGFESMIFNDTYILILGNNDDNKCKHLSSFPVVTLWEFC
jgi:hypothetical protein